jgi:hypothetical protein
VYRCSAKMDRQIIQTFRFLPRGRLSNGLGCGWVKKRSSIGAMPDLDRSVNLFEFSGTWFLYETFRTSS